MTMPSCVTCGDEVIGRGVVILEDEDVKEGGDHFLFDNHPKERVYENIQGRQYVVLHSTHFYSVFEEIMKRELQVMFVIAIGSIGDVFGEEIEEAI